MVTDLSFAPVLFESLYLLKIWLSVAESLVEPIWKFIERARRRRPAERVRGSSVGASPEPGAFWIRQGRDRDQLVQQVTEVLPGDMIVAPAVRFLAGRLAAGPLRRSRHTDFLLVHRTVEVSLLALPVGDLRCSTIVRLVEHGTGIGDQQRIRDDAVGQDEMACRGADADDHRAGLQHAPDHPEPPPRWVRGHIGGLRPGGINDVALLVALDLSSLQVVRGDRVQLAEVNSTFGGQFHLAGWIGIGPERLTHSQPVPAGVDTP